MPRLLCGVVLACSVGDVVGAIEDWDAADRSHVLTVDLTREGQNLLPPSPDKPVYYVPVVLGYKERGEIVKHYERRPNEEVILRTLIATLEKQGYRIASKEFPPTLTLSFEWGTVAPSFLDKRVLNTAEMRMIIIGESEWDVNNRYALDEINSLTARHYLLVSAFRYQRTAVQGKEDVLLWRAHSTTSAWGDYLDDVIQPMIKIASHGFGRSVKPAASWFNERTGTVKLGELKVVEEPPTNHQHET
ncbi:MAG: hypothetical protein WCR49_09665 [Opitutae bacterium]|jgi:hypothetical protein